MSSNKNNFFANNPEYVSKYETNKHARGTLPQISNGQYIGPSHIRNIDIESFLTIREPSHIKGQKINTEHEFHRLNNLQHDPHLVAYKVWSINGQQQNGSDTRNDNKDYY